MDCESINKEHVIYGNEIEKISFHDNSMYPKRIVIYYKDGTYQEISAKLSLSEYCVEPKLSFTEGHWGEL